MKGDTPLWIQDAVIGAVIRVRWFDGTRECRIVAKTSDALVVERPDGGRLELTGSRAIVKPDDHAGQRRRREPA